MSYIHGQRLIIAMILIARVQVYQEIGHLEVNLIILPKGWEVNTGLEVLLRNRKGKTELGFVKTYVETVVVSAVVSSARFLGGL